MTSHFQKTSSNSSTISTRLIEDEYSLTDIVGKLDADELSR